MFQNESEKPFSKRIIYIVWRHKNKLDTSFHIQGGARGKTKTVTLNYNKANYTYDEVKTLLVDAFLDDDNSAIFDGSSVQLGDCQGNVFTEFKLNNKKVKFWDYAKFLRQNRSKLTICLLTSERDSKSAVNDLGGQDDLDLPDYPPEKQNANAKNKVASQQLPDDGIIDLVGGEVVASDENTGNQIHTSKDGGNFKRPLSATPVKNKTKKAVVQVSVPFVPIDKFIFPEGQSLGQGGQGLVKKGTYQYVNYAVKCIKKSNFTDKLTLREIEILSCVRHDNIIRIMMFSENVEHYFIAMELFSGFSLEQVLFKQTVREQFSLDEDQLTNIAFQTTLGINYLHSESATKEKIFHSDIKPSNILVSNYFVDGIYYHIKIIDFGISRFIDFSTLLKSTCQRTSPVGTYPYMAPEIALQKADPSVASDVWAMACTFKELYSQEYVWPDQDIAGIITRLLAKEIPNLPINAFPEGIEDLLRKSLNYNPSERPTTDDYLVALSSLKLF